MRRRLRRNLDPRTVPGFEFALMLCGFWAAWVLYTPPSNFGTFRSSFALAAMLSKSETTWATIALSSALCFLTGFALAVIDWRVRCAWRFIQVGIVLSVLFWTAMGMSTVLGNPDTLYGVPILVMGGLLPLAGFHRHHDRAMAASAAVCIVALPFIADWLLHAR